MSDATRKPHVHRPLPMDPWRIPILAIQVPAHAIFPPPPPPPDDRFANDLYLRR